MVRWRRGNDWLMPLHFHLSPFLGPASGFYFPEAYLSNSAAASLSFFYHYLGMSFELADVLAGQCVRGPDTSRVGAIVEPASTKTFDETYDSLMHLEHPQRPFAPIHPRNASCLSSLLSYNIHQIRLLFMERWH